ncbi:MAG TPA: D-sedoheptulose 7-phosphate isomerase [Xanthobacteraceae bacterium]|nr:D-sedoheptulose 7-phosphate isomerase [Xanthobacteraceae bacterium]
MADQREQVVLDHFQRSCETLERAAKEPEMLAAILAIVDRITRALREGGKVMLAGNGGSAADSQHIAAELLGRYKIDRASLAAIALTTDTSALTSIGNDFSFDEIFERQVRGLGRRGDVFIGISTSGRSRNILAALKAARELGIATIGFTGMKGGQMRALCDLMLVAPSDDTALIQQIHITAAHAICGLVERDLYGAPPPR